MQEIDVSQHSSDWYIFEPRFLAQTIQLAQFFINKDAPAEVPTTEDKELDRQLAQQPARFWLNCAQMAELVHNGYPLSLVNYNDSLPVYIYVQNHLEMAIRALTNSMHTRDAPLDDLLILEAFAARVFGHARYLMPKSGGPSQGLITGLDITGLGESSIFKAAASKSLTEATAAPVEEDDGYQKRISYASNIVSLQISAISGV